MKLSTLMLAGLMTLTSVAAFAEGGAERSKEFYANFNFVQDKAAGKTEQTASTDTKKMNAAPTVQNSNDTQPKS